MVISISPSSEIRTSLQFHIFLYQSDYSDYSPSLPWTVPVHPLFGEGVSFSFDGVLKSPEEVDRPKMEVKFMDEDGSEAFHMVVDSHESTIQFTNSYIVRPILSQFILRHLLTADIFLSLALLLYPPDRDQSRRADRGDDRDDQG